MNKVGRFKNYYLEIVINLDDILSEKTRTSSNILDVLGNCGGIMEILLTISSYIFEPISELVFNMLAIMAFYKIRFKNLKESLNDEVSKSKDEEKPNNSE